MSEDLIQATAEPAANAVRSPEIDMGLYDSATGATLVPDKVVDITDLQTDRERVLLVYTKAERGRIVQLHRDGARIHYFLDEPGGAAMVAEDEERFGFQTGALLRVMRQNA